MTDTRARTVLGPVVAAALLVLTGCGGGGSGGDSGSSSTDASGKPSPQESSAEASSAPGLEGVPDVVAEVNGEEVTRDEFDPLYAALLQQATVQAQSTGQPPDEAVVKEQAVTQLVDTELLAQEAEARGLTVTDEDVETELASLAKDYQLGSAEKLLSALAKQGTTAEQARVQVRKQIMLERLVEDEAGEVAPTEKELRATYAQAKAQAQQGGTKIPPYAEARAQLLDQATSQQQAKVADGLVQTLRKDADITINLE